MNWRDELRRQMGSKWTCMGCERSYDEEVPHRMIQRVATKGDATTRACGWVCSDDCAARTHGLLGVTVDAETN